MSKVIASEELLPTMTMGERGRTAFIMFIISIWLFCMDGLYYAIDDTDWDADKWAIVLLSATGCSKPHPCAFYIIYMIMTALWCTGFTFGMFGCICAVMILAWLLPRECGIVMLVILVLCTPLRAIAAAFGFDDFTDNHALNSTTNYLSVMGMPCVFLSFMLFVMQRHCVSSNLSLLRVYIYCHKLGVFASLDDYQCFLQLLWMMGIWSSENETDKTLVYQCEQ